MAIDSFDGMYRRLSNFSVSPIEYEGVLYPGVEWAFAAAKTLNVEQRKLIAKCSTPGETKRMGRHVTLRPNWTNGVRDQVMLDLLRLKFAIPEYKDFLLSTGDTELIEGNTWNDTYWGCVRVNGQWVGSNQLGKLLMKVREELKAA
jgi:ribA/ribD-fused uncharacterized protein